MDIAIILPAYNEEQTICETINAFFQQLPEAKIVVINNNSSDDTASLAERTFKQLGATGFVIHEGRQGKGNAVRRAFMSVEADIYVMSDADMTYPAYRLTDLLAPVLDGRADMVVGDRLSNGDYILQNKRGFHNFGNNLVRALVNRLFKADLKDIMSGYRVFNRKFVKNYPVMVEGFEVETDLTLHALDKRFRILEVPVEYINRPEGSFSKLSTFADGAKVIFIIVQVLRYYRPLLFFGSLSVFFAIMGVLFSLPVFEDWLMYRQVYRLPSAILAASLELVAVVTFGVGMILDSITHMNKMMFEKDLLRNDLHNQGKSD